jgi:putative transposase
MAAKKKRRHFTPEYKAEVVALFRKPARARRAARQGVRRHAMSDRIDRALVIEALRVAVGRRAPDAGLLHHFDRGSQYASGDYQDALRERGVVFSMSRKGNCWDNAVAESFFATLKTECIYSRRFATRAEAREAIFDFIEVFYNRRRLHSTLGYVSPMEFEMKFIEEKKNREYEKKAA